MALSGKRFLLTGGAGFIGTTLARRLVDDNELVVLDNLHRDALSGSELEGHPNLTFHEGDVLDAELVRELARGTTHVIHLAAIAGVDTVRESPVPHSLQTARANPISGMAVRARVTRRWNVSSFAVRRTTPRMSVSDIIEEGLWVHQPRLTRPSIAVDRVRVR